MTKELALKNSEKALPVRAIPNEETLNRVVLEIGTFLDRILMLNGEKSIKNLEILLPMIKNDAWSLSYNEVVEAFTMYALHELPIEPIDNYISVSRFSKVIKEYKRIKFKPKKVNEADYKDVMDMAAAENYFEHYRSGGDISEQELWLYHYIFDFKQAVKIAKDVKLEVFNEALEEFKGDKPAAIEKSKRTLLKRFFDDLNSKGLHLKGMWNEKAP